MAESKKWSLGTECLLPALACDLTKNALDVFEEVQRPFKTEPNSPRI
jgi:hypothetical protein